MDLKSEKAKALTKKQVFDELRSYLNEQVDISNRKCMDEENLNFLLLMSIKLIKEVYRKL